MLDPAHRQRRQHGRRVRRRGGVATEIFGISPLPRRADRRRSLIWALVLFASYRTVERVFLGGRPRVRRLHRLGDPGPPGLGRRSGGALVTPSLDLSPGDPAADGRGRRHDDHAVHAVLPPERRRREGHRRGGAAARAGRRGRRRDLDERHRDLHRRRDRDDDLRRRAARSRRRPTPRRASSRSPADFAELLFAIGLFGASVLAATIMPISTAYVICEAFGWESGVGKRFGDARAFFGIYTFVLVIGALVVLIPGTRPDCRSSSPRRTSRACCCRSSSSSWSCSSTTGG